MTKVKSTSTKSKQAEHWQQLYLQAKAEGNTRLMKLYEALIIKLGSVPTKL